MERRDSKKFKRRLYTFKDHLLAMTPMTIGLLLVLSALVPKVNGQSDCKRDADCKHNQYCYEISEICVNYTQCGRYNREEGAQPARRANQCGRCLPKYSADTNPNGGEPDSCTLASEIESTNSDWSYLYWILVIFGFTFGVIALSYFCISKKICCYKPEDEPEKPGLPMLPNTINASAPPLPSIRNNNNYDNAEESLPLSSMGEHRGIVKIDHDKPVLAQSFTPPYWVNRNPSYDPDDQAVGTVRVSSETSTIDEETVPSVWRPTEQAAIGPISNRPFHAINMPEQEDNATNTALDDARLRPTPSTNDERRQPGGGGVGGGRQYNGGSFPSDSENNNTNNSNNSGSENRRGNPPSTLINFIYLGIMGFLEILLVLLILCPVMTFPVNDSSIILTSSFNVTQSGTNNQVQDDQALSFFEKFQSMKHGAIILGAFVAIFISVACYCYNRRNDGRTDSENS